MFDHEPVGYREARRVGWGPNEFTSVGRGGACLPDDKVKELSNFRQLLSAASSHELAEPLEQVQRVVGARGGLRVVLHAEGASVRRVEAFAGAVVQVHVGRARVTREGVDVHHEAVVLRGDLDAAGGQIFDRLVQPAVAELELVGCLLYTSDAADERSSVDLGGRRIIKKKKQI